MQTTISVIVPVYKIDTDLLERCLGTLISQSDQNAEFIVIDDGSPDNCGEICDKYGQMDSRMKVIHTENLGVSNARNVGLRNATGEYVVFVDGDDYVECDLCEKVYAAMEKVKSDILFFMHVTTKNPVPIVKDDGQVWQIPYETLEDIRKAIVEQSEPLAGVWVGPPWGKVFRRSVIEENDLSFVLGLKKSQDRVFVFDYMLHATTAACFNYVGYHYVSNEDSVCHKYNPNIIQILEHAQEEFNKRVNALESKKTYEQSIYTMNLIFFTEYLVLYILNKDNPANDKVRCEMIKMLIKQSVYKKALKYGKMNNIGRRKRIVLWLIKLHCVTVAVKLSRFVWNKFN